MKRLLIGLIVLFGLILATLNGFPMMTYILGGNWYLQVDNFNYSLVQALTMIYLISIIVYKIL